MKTLLRRTLRVLIGLFVLLNIMAAVHAYNFTHFYANPSLKRHNEEQMSLGEKASSIFLGVKSPKSVNQILPTVKYETIYLKSFDVKIFFEFVRTFKTV